MAFKGQKYKQWTENEKLEIIKPILDMHKSSSQVTKDTGINNGLKNKKKNSNPLAKYSNRKHLNKEEKLEYENMKLRIENELLKKGYLMKGDGTLVAFKHKNK